MKNSKVIAELTESGIVIKLENWEGVSNVMLERIHYAIVKESQVYRAHHLGALHKERMEAENAAKTVVEVPTANEAKSTGSFFEGLKNVLTR